MMILPYKKQVVNEFGEKARKSMAAVHSLRRGTGARTVTSFPAHIHSTKVKIAIAEAIWYNISVKITPDSVFFTQDVFAAGRLQTSCDRIGEYRQFQSPYT